MKRLAGVLKKYVFLIVLIAVFAVIDMLIANNAPNYIIESGKFWLNDFELTQRDNPDEVWDKVFFGNSAVYAAYRQEESESGYVNLGMDNAVLTDLWDMLRKGEIKLGSELVLGLNWLTLYDDFETNPSYIWHRGLIEPYSYFQRDRLSEMLINQAKQIVLGVSATDDFSTQTKTRYRASLSDDALIGKAEEFAQRYWNADSEAFKENYTALKNIIEYYSRNELRVRIIWMPWNPKVEVPALVREVMETVNSICNDYGVEVYDVTDLLDVECFADIAHLNYEYGSHKFTEEVDRWLQS